jgi:ABC-type Mn2+/Zn2+ transport system ATPase subunit
MPASTKDSFRISRIRLINFHNFVDELIDVRNGGHLFLLGDNGSGKTTVIDALHYVLTAGESMEFNSAARVAGRKSEGRKPQGIVSRYNVGKGHLNPKGAVTYAALEICRQGRTSVIAIGMSINSPDDNLSRWGIVRECSLEDIPFMVEELGGRRPRDKFEMRQALDKSGYYGQVSQYKKVVAERFIGGMESFSEFCRFLHMGKAYREIVTNSADYHDLFKKLLPEKRIELFENIINSLREIESDTGDLDKLRYKLRYIEDLKSLVTQVTEHRREVLAFEHFGLSHDIERQERKLEQLADERTALEAELADLATRQEELQKDQDQQTKLLGDLKAKDSEGIVEREKDQAKKLEETAQALKELDSTIKTQTRQLKQVQKQADAQEGEVRKLLSGQLQLCGRLSAQLPFSAASYMQALDHLVHLECLDSLELLPVEEMRRTAEAAHSENQMEQGRLQALLNEAEKRETALVAELDNLRREPEAKPLNPQFAAAETALRQAMIDGQPLYKGLEWKAGLSAADRNRREELIGESVLGTLIVRDSDWEKARELILPQFPGIRLARRRDVRPGHELALWIRDSFDLGTCDPAALLVLDEEMHARREPEFLEENGGNALAFRGHERGLLGEPARLIGSEARQREQQTRIKHKENELSECRRELRELEAAKARIETAIKVIAQFRELFGSGLDALRQGFSALLAARQDMRQAQETLDSLQTRHGELHADVGRFNERLKTLRDAISSKGLATLDKKIQACQRKLGQFNILMNDLAQHVGAKGQKLLDAETACEERMVKLEDLYTRHTENAEMLQQQLGEQDLVSYLETSLSKWNYSSMEEFRDLYETTRQNSRDLQVQISERLKNLEYGAFYGFTYDQEQNRLFDRHQCQIADLVASLRKSIHEQEEVINDKTTSLFRNVIQNSLVGFIIENVTRLRDMVKDINRLLGDRTFGMNRYRLQLSPQKDYERFVKTFENYNSFNETSAKELEELLQDYRESILSSEVNTIPAVLDYRNWFRYEMKVSAAEGDEGGQVITRNLKSLGSGGEQAVPNYLLIMTIARFLYQRSNIRLHVMLFDEAFYGIDEERRNQLMGFATDLGLQLFVASPDQDGVRREIAYATSLFVLKDENFDVHLYANHFENPNLAKQLDLFEQEAPPSLEFEPELGTLGDA